MPLNKELVFKSIKDLTLQAITVSRMIEEAFDVKANIISFTTSTLPIVCTVRIVPFSFTTLGHDLIFRLQHPG